MGLSDGKMPLIDWPGDDVLVKKCLRSWIDVHNKGVLMHVCMEIGIYWTMYEDSPMMLPCDITQRMILTQCACTSQLVDFDTCQVSYFRKICIDTASEMEAATVDPLSVVQKIIESLISRVKQTPLKSSGTIDGLKILIKTTFFVSQCDGGISVHIK